MKTSSLLFGASICVFIAGCGLLIPRTPPDCSSTQCTVTVTATLTAPGICNIQVDKQAVSVPNDGTPRQIVWSLVAAADFTFPNDPINQKGNWQGDFRGPNLVSPTRFELTDLNNPRTAKKTYDYGVKVAYRGQQCGELDPVIINDM